MCSPHPQVGGYARHTGAAARLEPLYRIVLNEDFFPRYEPSSANNVPDPSTGTDVSSAGGGGDPLPRQTCLLSPVRVPSCHLWTHPDPPPMTGAPAVRSLQRLC